MAERLDLTAPVQPPPVTSYRVVYLVIDRRNARILVELEGSNGEQLAHQWDTADTLIRALNTANLTIKSLERRILERLVTDGRFTGNVAGVPD